MCLFMRLEYEQKYCASCPSYSVPIPKRDILRNFINYKYASILLISILIAPIVSWASSQPIVEIITNKGRITVELAADKAPVTVNNFLAYMHEGFYESTIFHRVIDGFMIQGGGYNENLDIFVVHPPIILESNTGLSHVRGTIAMARRTDPDTASSQFFINTADNLFWDYQSLSAPGYAVFGVVLEGMDVVDAISHQPTNKQSVATAVAGEPLFLRNVPIEPVVIETMRLRDGQLNFSEMSASYTAGETVAVILQETMPRTKLLDLWVAIMGADGRLLYVTETGFSSEPSAFKAQVPVNETRHSVFNFSVPQGFTGQYTLFAIFNKPGSGIDDINHSLRSNIAQISIEML